MNKIICGFLLFYCGCAYAQQGFELPESENSSTPYRPRVAEFTVSTLYDYHTTSSSDELGAGQSEVERDYKVKARLGLPIVLKSDLVMCFQLKYDRQRFIVENESGLPSTLYEHLQDTKFTNLGGRFYVQRKFDNKEISGIIGAELSSDQFNWNRNTTKIYANVNYTVRKNDNVKLGAGLAVSYALARPQVYPLFFYENKLSPKWTLDLALPKSAIMRYMINEKSYLSLKTELKGWRYAVHNQELSSSETLTLRKSDVQLGLQFERELHDWLWFGLEAGVTKNINHYLVEAGGSRRDAIVELSTNDAPYTRFSIFIVPPKKLYK